MVDIFGVIADPSRRKILELLSEQETGNSTATVELNVSQLVELTELTQPSVSKQLKVLRESGLVHSRSEGQQRFYSVEPEGLEIIANWVATFLPEPAVEADNEAQTAGKRTQPEAFAEDLTARPNEPALTPLLPEWPESVLGLVRDAGEAFSTLQGQAVRTFDYVGDKVEKVKKTGRRLRS